MKKLTWFYKYLIFNLKTKFDLDKDTFESASLDELFNFYGSDKGTKVCDPYSKKSLKIGGHGFGKFYEHNFTNLKREKFNFLEIGTWRGASLASFLKFFKNADIYGIDKNFKLKFKSKRLFFKNCDTTDIMSVNNLKNYFLDKKFKIIVDDGSHLLNDIIHNLKIFSRFLDKYGTYVIEDYNHPKYFNFLNNSNGHELHVDQIIKNLKDKIFFKSKILNEQDQKFFHKSLKSVSFEKGEMIEGGNNISDIAFLRFN